jgi:hypothetical protein
MTRKHFTLLAFFLMANMMAGAQPADFTWTTQSRNSSESMPCGGGSVGMNVWVEKGDILLYICRSGSFDENNTLLKAGRVRIRLTPAMAGSAAFRQILNTNDGYVTITDGQKTVTLWVDVFKPVVHIDVDSRQKVAMTASYESWRTTDRPLTGSEFHQTSYKFLSPADVMTRRDSIRADGGSVTFFHHNTEEKNIFGVTLGEQGLDSLASRMYNPIKDLTFGGRMSGEGFRFEGTSDGTYDLTPYRAWNLTSTESRRHQTLRITLATLQGTVDQWQKAVAQTEAIIDEARDLRASRLWWNRFWTRSFIESDGESAAYTRNFTLFRYMLGCNALSEWPTKFNGGLFTFDPSLVAASEPYTPDFRRWGGGTHTAQNQRLVYWPMIKNGDSDALRSQLDFYLRILPNALLRSQAYWHHGGASFTEQIENFGLPEYFEYGPNRPAGYDKSMQYNAWLEYTWDTVLEFCQMAFDAHSSLGMDIEKYVPLVQQSLTFFDLHYRYLARQRGTKELDGDGHLVLYPGSGGETFKMAYNATSTVAALKTVTQSLLRYMQGKPQYDSHIKYDSALLRRIPDIAIRKVDSLEVIAPAVVWGRVNNEEPTMLYPVFPWHIYGMGRPGLDIARNTYLHDPYALRFRSHIGWKQDAIWAADLGLTDEAARLLRLKLSDGPYRFPAFWGPGFDWSPDHNWGGSGMIAMQEMLMLETPDGKILLFPAWPKHWNVHFKLHASACTTVEATLRDGRLTQLKVEPQQRARDVVVK